MSVPAASPTSRLLLGLAVTLAAVAVFSWYALRQINGLKDLQTRTIDRNRKDSLQLLRIQNDLDSVGLALRDMLDGSEPYPIQAWKGQFDRIRTDLNDALRIEAELAPAPRHPERREYLINSLAQFWSSVDRMFILALRDQSAPARDLIHTSLQAQQAALTTTVARLLVGNNEAEEQAAAQVQSIYRRVERNVYYLLAAALITISLTSLYLIQSNRRLFDRLAMLSNQRSELTRKLITMQEQVLRSIARELHDEFGQILTAIGVMLRRAETQGLPPDSPFRVELQQAREVAQATLEKTRSLSQVLHPAILDDGGLERALDWYLPLFEKQTGIRVRYEKHGSGPVLAGPVAVHVYRVLQEALNNLAQHSQSTLASVRLQFSLNRLDLEVEDGGIGLPEEKSPSARRGMGMMAMRERAELLQGKIEFLRPPAGGTLVRLQVPLEAGASYDG